MGPYTKYEVTRMGILKDSSTGKTYNQEDIISNDTKPSLINDIHIEKKSESARIFRNLTESWAGDSSKVLWF